RNNFYWNGSTWTNGGGSPVWNAAAVSGANDPKAWTYSVNYATNAWFDGFGYNVRTRAKDNVLPASNQENNGNGNTPASFTFDINLPTATIALPVNGQYLSGLTTLSGTMADPNDPTFVHIATVTLRLKD